MGTMLALREKTPKQKVPTRKNARTVTKKTLVAWKIELFVDKGLTILNSTWVHQVDAPVL
jgi:hypothetical protein